MDIHTGFGPPPVMQNGISLHENPYTPPDIECDQEKSSLGMDLVSDQCKSIYEQPFDSCSRTDSFKQCRTST